MNLMEIGVVTKPQGLNGQVRVKLYSNDTSILTDIKHIYLNDSPIKIMKLTNRNTFVVLKLEHINDITQAEALRNTPVFVKEEDIVLQQDEVLVNQLIGWKVISAGVVLGTVKDVNNYGAGDVYTVVKDNGAEFMFVNANGLVLNLDESQKQVLVDGKKLSEMSV